jgi:chemotaxis protein MotB
LSGRLHAGTFFDPASAALRPEVLPVLDAVAEELSALQRAVKVEGHTDHSPVQGSVYPTNWHLSASRAAAVSAYLVDKHTFGRELLSATGYADTRPLQSNDTEEGREANRRIELVVNVSPDDSLDAITR